MLIELRIQNFAVIDQLELRIGPGLNVLSGETGAGKSIVVGALSLLLGERASSDLVRAGDDRAVIEGVFDIGDRSAILESLNELGIEPEEGLLILRREVAVEGRSRAWINGSPATAGMLAQVGRQLVDMHGQHEHQTLLRSDEQREILDEYAGTRPLLRSVRSAYGKLRQAERDLDEHDAESRQAEQQAEFFRHQLQEIEKAELRPGEEEEIEEEANRLDHAEDLAILSNRLHLELYASESAVIARLAELRKVLEQLVRIDPGQSEALELFEPAYINFEELGRRFGDYSAGIEHDPARLDHLRRRQDLIFRLKTRYGPELEDVIETGRRARAALDLIDGSSFERRALEKRLEEARAELAELAKKLTERRRGAATRLAEEVEEILPEVGLGGGIFEIGLSELDTVGPDGAEQVEFRIALNVGFEPRPLARVASGGELSRVMLALKTVLASQDKVPTLIFDEIDTGIGGQIGHRVGEKLREVADQHQVFVITHLAQIACRADQHLLVEKGATEGTTSTSVRDLDQDSRVRELARMLGGDPESATSQEHARELLGSVALP